MNGGASSSLDPLNILKSPPFATGNGRTGSGGSQIHSSKMQRRSRSAEEKRGKSPVNHALGAGSCIDQETSGGGALNWFQKRIGEKRDSKGEKETEISSHSIRDARSPSQRRSVEREK